MTQIILRPRQAGKTTELIKKADDFNGYIVCHNRQEAQRIAKQARDMGAKIHLPMTYAELLNRSYHARGVRKVHIDNADFLLQFLVPNVAIETVTINDTLPPAA